MESPTTPNPLSLDLYDQPGHLIRRAQQIAALLFREVLGPDVTPVQYAILRMLQESPGIDQVTLARLVALDNSTTADIAARLESKGWIHRELLPRRQRRLSLTTEGEAMLAAFVPNVYELQQRSKTPSQTYYKHTVYGLRFMLKGEGLPYSQDRKSVV